MMSLKKTSYIIVILRTQNKEKFVHGNSYGDMCLVNTKILQWMAELSIPV